MRTQLLTVVLLMLASFPSYAQWRERRAALTEMHQAGEFRIFYSLSGTDALPSREDSDRNGIPDYVDRLARNFATARRYFEQELRLRHPLRSPRYGNEAEFIDVNILRFPLSANGPRHGIAYDELSSFARPKDQGRRVKVVVIDVSHDMPPANRTPAHELFHVYQNGYTYFKNRWYTEGTARWAEDFDGRSGTRDARAWPRSAGDLQDLFSKSYETASFWQSVAVKVDPQNRGKAFVRTFLEELDRIDDTVRATDTSRPWKEADQFSKTNDTYIWEALRVTLRKPEYLAHWDADIRALMEMKR